MHPGGLYLLKGVSGRVARGAFREVVPVHRLAYSFGWEGDEEVPPGSSLIEIDLIDRDGGTLLRMTHSGLPNAAQCASHDKGWAHYLGRLAHGGRRSKSRHRSFSRRRLTITAIGRSRGVELPREALLPIYQFPLTPLRSASSPPTLDGSFPLNP